MQLKLFSFQEYEYSSLEGDIRKIAASLRTKNIKFNSVIKFTTLKEPSMRHSAKLKQNLI